MGYTDAKPGGNGRKGEAGPLAKLKGSGKQNDQIKPSNGGKPKKVGK
jgi:hypothetical protein